MTNTQAYKHYEFAHLLRGIAALTVALLAHLIGIAWLSPQVMTTLLHVNEVAAKSIPKWIIPLYNLAPLNWAHLGVSLFFLISGFVIPFSCSRLKPAAFFITRIFRIYPTYWTGFSCSILTIFILNPDNTISWKHIGLQYFLVRDLFWLPCLDGISWTLEVEIKFYLLCTLIPHIITKVNTKKLFLISIILGFLAVYLGNMPISITLPHAIDLSLVYIIYMFIGVFFYWHANNFLSSLSLILLILLMQCWFICICFLNPDTTLFSKGIAINYSISIILFAFCYLWRDTIKCPSFFRWIANISYPLYVVHPIVGYGLLYQLIYINNVNSTVALPLTLIIVFALAHSIHKLVELPSNLYGKRIAAKLNNLKNTEAYSFVHKAFRLPLN